MDLAIAHNSFYDHCAMSNWAANTMQLSNMAPYDAMCVTSDITFAYPGILCAQIQTAYWYGCCIHYKFTVFMYTDVRACVYVYMLVVVLVEFIFSLILLHSN